MNFALITLVLVAAVALALFILFATILNIGAEIMSKIDDLTAAVAAEKTVEDSAIALLMPC